MLQNAYFLAKIGADTAENQLHFAEILPKTGNYPTVSRAAAAAEGGGPRAGAAGSEPAGAAPARCATARCAG